MASPQQQPQLRRRLSAFLFNGLIGLACVLMLASAYALEPVPRSGYGAFAGGEFYLLTDSSFGSNEQALVRLEIGDNGSSADLKRYGGADVRLYRVPEPLAFLQQQKNPHRIVLNGKYRGEGVANTISYLWDSWYKAARRSWQRILSTDTRQAATKDAPQLKTGRFISQPTPVAYPNQFAPLPGLPLAASFRYPLWQAKPIAPPADVKLEGSSSNFLATKRGNVLIPLGKLKPGLYVVEAMLGAHRANTLLFVSDTIAMTKSASGQLLAWTVSRQHGTAVPGTRVQWSDGAGLLQSGVSDNRGLLEFKRSSPEKSYLYGMDPAGGVFISENFYYDSEIYNTKLYAFTDRPMYRPGDEVNVKFLGRHFSAAQSSARAADGELTLAVLDPSGLEILRHSTRFSGKDGADARFRLPAGAPPGGYEVRFKLGEDSYSAEFRVADYIKPHFEMHLELAKPAFKTGEAINGRIVLRYPDGRPVKNGRLTLAVRSQQTTMVDGELHYSGQFPLKLQQQELSADDNGVAKFSLPPAKDPSRYVLTMLASEGAAFRVKATRELLIERGSTAYRLSTARQFTEAGQTVSFNWAAQGEGGSPPAAYELVRLESQTRSSGKIPAGARSLQVAFASAGSYTLQLKDRHGNLLGATSHWVAGKELQAAPGSVEIVFDKYRYQVGEVAEALLTFPEAINDALLTLERDQVEHMATLGQGGAWFQATRVAPKQWKVRIPVNASFTPNITFSVLYARHGAYVFQNAGILVAQPAIQTSIRTAKAVYQPGEQVTVELQTLLAGKPVPAQLTVSVVDELVYVLQPELAPAIQDFFYHPRRNSVRTGSSLNFVGYDKSLSHLPGATPPANRFNERGVKVLERPRRDETDTAAWMPSLRTGADGRAKFTFTMPDSLTRWRITARAMADSGVVGQRTAYVRSEQDFYLKWTGPKLFRDGDQAQISLLAFNRGQTEAAATLETEYASQRHAQQITLKPGANYLPLPVDAKPGALTARLKVNGQQVDALSGTVRTQPVPWASPRQVMVPISAADTSLPLPADARDVRLTFLAAGAGQFARVMDDLIDYPYGCTEQTASRLLPLAMAYRSASDLTLAARLQARLQAERMRLIKLAGVDGSFGWWGSASDGSALMSAYAYHTDWYVAKSLGIQLPAGHGEGMLEIYRQTAKHEPVLARALILWWMRQMGLPVDTLLLGVDAELETAQPVPQPLRPNDSVLFAAPNSERGLRLALLLSAQLHRELGTPQPPALAERSAAALQALQSAPPPLEASLLLLGKQAAPALSAEQVLAQVSPAMPTLERALALLWLQQGLDGAALKPAPTPQLTGGWRSAATVVGRPQWLWPQTARPRTLQLAAAPAQPLQAVLNFNSYQPEASKLPLTLRRTLYRLEPGAKALAFTAKRVKDGEALRSDALYVDELELTPKAKQMLHYGLLEVPLPPGGEVEGTSWGLQIDGLSGQDKAAAFPRRDYSEGVLSYQVPLPKLNQAMTVRQLVRFSQRGRFQLPPARYFRMYQPEDKAMQDGTGASHVWQVE